MNRYSTADTGRAFLELCALLKPVWAYISNIESDKLLGWGSPGMHTEISWKPLGECLLSRPENSCADTVLFIPQSY